ncbi:MAG: hypothetical protein CMI29_06800 [Opitutae bacterium]|nr:hypothetical protein [Opitutae bacterium]
MIQHFKYNGERLKHYDALFESVLAGEHSKAVAANLLVDIRWAEVSRAFASCLLRRSQVGPIRPLAADFGHLIDRAAEVAFGTRAHARIPSWFLQNNEAFLASTMQKLLTEFLRRPAAPLQMRRAFTALFEVAEALKSYMGLRELADSTGAHALMCAVAHARYDFLGQSVRCCASPWLCLADMLAERILIGDEPESMPAFAFFAHSERWQAFAKATVGCFSAEGAFVRLQRMVEARALPREREREQGLFFLASAFLKADAAASDGSPERPSVLAKPLRSPIRKRSAPFVRLIKRLVSKA